MKIWPRPQEVPETWGKCRWKAVGWRVWTSGLFVVLLQRCVDFFDEFPGPTFACPQEVWISIGKYLTIWQAW